MTFLNREDIVKENIAKAEREVEEAVAAERNEIPAKPEDNQPQEEPSQPAADGHDWKKRAADKDRYITKLKKDHEAEVNAFKDQLKALEDKVSSMARAQSPAELPQTAADIEALKTENPAAYHAFIGIATKVAEDMVQDRLRGMERDVAEVKKARKEAAEEAAFIMLQKRHPDIDIQSLETDEEFNEWISGKSKRTQDALFNNKEDVDAASEVLDLYRYEVLSKKAKPAKPQSKPGIHEVAPKGQPNIPSQQAGWEFTESQLEEMDRKDPRWFERNIEKIEKAMREGRILKDVSDPLGSQRRMAAMGM